MASRIQLRRDTAARWTSINPVLGNGEPGIETDTGKQKFGNGTSVWTALPYASEGPQGPAGVADDGSVATLVSSPTSSTRTALNATILDAIEPKLDKTEAAATYASKDGKVIHRGPKTLAGVQATLAAAEALGKGTVAHFPAGVYDLGAGLSLAGFSCQIQGEGAAGSTASPAGTTFYASAQNGPVIDYTGWVKPEGMQGKTVHGGFNVKGSGVSDPTKNNAGVRFKSISSALFHDIGIRETGGPGLQGVESVGDAVYLCDFERVVVSTPVDAKANDVPYVSFIEANGNNFRGLAIRSRTYSADCGVSGAVVIKSNSTWASQWNVFSGCWVEFIHVPTNGTIFAIEANKTVFTDTILFDALHEDNATGTSYFRFTPPPSSDLGGNVVRGVIPGKGTNAVKDISMGIDMRQSNNRVEGTKGYNGLNVVIAAGIGGTYVEFGGAESNPSNVGWVDNSGLTTNTLIDHHYGTVIYGAKNAVGNPMHKIAGLHLSNRLGSSTYTTNFTINYSSGNIHNATLGASAAITALNGGVVGAELTVILRQDATGGRVITSWPSTVKWAGGTAPVLSAAPNAVDILRLLFDGTNWRELSRSIGT